MNKDFKWSIFALGFVIFVITKNPEIFLRFTICSVLCFLAELVYEICKLIIFKSYLIDSKKEEKDGTD